MKRRDKSIADLSHETSRGAALLGLKYARHDKKKTHKTMPQDLHALHTYHYNSIVLPGPDRVKRDQLSPKCHVTTVCTCMKNTTLILLLTCSSPGSRIIFHGQKGVVDFLNLPSHCRGATLSNSPTC